MPGPFIGNGEQFGISDWAPFDAGTPVPPGWEFIPGQAGAPDRMRVLPGNTVLDNQGRTVVEAYPDGWYETFDGLNNSMFPSNYNVRASPATLARWWQGTGATPVSPPFQPNSWVTPPTQLDNVVEGIIQYGRAAIPPGSTVQTRPDGTIERIILPDPIVGRSTTGQGNMGYGSGVAIDCDINGVPTGVCTEPGTGRPIPTRGWLIRIAQLLGIIEPNWTPPPPPTSYNSSRSIPLRPGAPVPTNPNFGEINQAPGGGLTVGGGINLVVTAFQLGLLTSDYIANLIVQPPLPLPNPPPLYSGVIVGGFQMATRYIVTFNDQDETPQEWKLDNFSMSINFVPSTGLWNGTGDFEVWISGIHVGDMTVTITGFNGVQCNVDLSKSYGVGTLWGQLPVYMASSSSPLAFSTDRFSPITYLTHTTATHNPPSHRLIIFFTPA